MRRLLVPIEVVVLAVLGASCGRDEPAPFVEPTSAFRPTGSTDGTTGATRSGVATGATAGTATGIDQPPTTTVAVGTGKLMRGQAAFTVTGDLRASKALPVLVNAAYSPPPGVLALVWAAGGADPSNVGLGGLSFTGTKPTSPTLTLTVTVQAKSTIATFVSSAGECSVTIGQASADRLSGAFNCTNLSDGADRVNLTGSFNAQG